jgi:hypothetical protein
MPDHAEIIQRAENILQSYLGDMQNAMDEIFDLLESANYVVQDNDEDYAKADEFFGFIIQRVISEWTPATDPFEKNRTMHVYYPNLTKQGKPCKRCGKLPSDPKHYK